MEKKVKISRMEDIEQQNSNASNNYQYYRHKFIKGEDGFGSNIAFLRLPPKKAAFPLHYHEYGEETISGTGRLLIKGGECEVKAGDIVFFPSGIEGTHKLKIIPLPKDLICIDFGTKYLLTLHIIRGKIRLESSVKTIQEFYKSPVPSTCMKMKKMIELKNKAAKKI